MSAPSLAEELEACTERCRSMDAPLARRLQAFAEDVRRLSPDFADIVDRMVDRLATAKAGVGAPDVGAVMPTFVLPDEEGRLVGLTQLLERGPVVMSFHRGHWCPYCIINAEAMAKLAPQLTAAGAQMVVIVPETQKYARSLKQETGATFPILTDLDCGYALSLELAFKVPHEKQIAMTEAGFDISDFNDNSSWTLPIPATFVVGQDGRVRARFVDPDYRKRMAVEAILSALG